MLQKIVLIVLALIIAIGGGIWSVYYFLHNFDGFDRLKIGQWEAGPKVGTDEADAYASAKAAKNGDISLGHTEGLSFQLWKDDKNQPLKAQCTYILQGMMPEARLFTLYTVNNAHEPQWPNDVLPTMLDSNNIIRQDNGGIYVTIAPDAATGNWLATKNREEYGLILTLYDTPIATTTSQQNIPMPVLTYKATGVRGCD